MKYSSGFTLIEILVTLFLIAGGLLGVAGIQIASLNSNQAAYIHTQASLIGYDIIDRMRANSVHAKLFAASTYAVTKPKDAVIKENCSINCNTSDLAENDLFEWFNQIKMHLPGCALPANYDSCATITAANNSSYTITLRWDDNRDGSVNNNDPPFTLNFEFYAN